MAGARGDTAKGCLEERMPAGEGRERGTAVAAARYLCV